MIKIELPDKVRYILNTIHQAGFEAYIVGGCVRDSLLGRTPDDWDITTSATPLEVKALFTHTIDTGIIHGTVTVMIHREGFEVTTYRIDGEYLDNRRPSEVLFTSLLEEDLKRRDFTINAMAYNEKEGLIDLFEGQIDIKHRKIRCVGNAVERFGEDALRIMRAVRFSAQLGYEIDEETEKAIEYLAGTLQCISVERVQVEFMKLLLSDHPEYIIRLYRLGITKIVLPEFDVMMDTEQNTPHHKYNVGEHTICALQATEKDRILRLAVFFHDIAKPYTKTTGEDGVDHFYGHMEYGAKFTVQVLKRLRFDNDTIKVVSRLVAHHDCGNTEEITGSFTRKLMYSVGSALFPILLKLKEADISGQSDYQFEQKKHQQERLRHFYDLAIQGDECVSLKQLKITGKDLMEAGMKPGKQIGEVLEALLESVILEPEENEKILLLNKVKKMGYI
ncbi:MAG: CCA tRNA nucleotidyltransferase [Lachnospiraceae bacterium]